MEFVDWGLIDYEQSLHDQEVLVEKVAAEKAPGVVVFCSHPAVVTLGRKTQPGDLFAWDGPVKEISRGGRATYHGPSQQVVYPVVNLDVLEPHRDIAWYLRSLENAIIATLADYGIEAVGKSLRKKSADDSGAEETGVWVGDKKIASIGIAVRKWITFHGAAINLDEDPKAFQGMNPCGFKSDVMTNLQRLTGKDVARQEFQQRLQKNLQKIFIH